MRPAERRLCVGRMAKSFSVARPNWFVRENFLVNAEIAKPAKTIRPTALRRGDRIGLLAPASSFNREAFLAGCDHLRQMGYEPVYSPDIFARDIYFAGSAERRAHEFHDFWRRDDIAAL